MYGRDPALRRGPKLLSGGSNLTRLVDRDRSASERLRFLDGIRGWGALFVVLYHMYIQICPITPGAQSVMKRIFVFNGMLAVVLFFVVSGYSLSVGFLRTGDGRNS